MADVVMHTNVPFFPHGSYIAVRQFKTIFISNLDAIAEQVPVRLFIFNAEGNKQKSVPIRNGLLHIFAPDDVGFYFFNAQWNSGQVSFSYELK